MSKKQKRELVRILIAAVGLVGVSLLPLFPWQRPSYFWQCTFLLVGMYSGKPSATF